MQNTPQHNAPNRPERSRAARPWLFGGLFVWALVGAVGIAANSSRTIPPVSTSKPAPVAGASGLAPIEATNQKIAWEDSFEGAMQRARAEKKPIMVSFYTDWCGWCKELDRQVFPDQSVVSESKNWVSIKINAEKRPDVAGAYGVTGYPTIIFAQSSGKPLDVLSGFAPPAEFMAKMQSARGKLAS